MKKLIIVFVVAVIIIFGIKLFSSNKPQQKTDILSTASVTTSSQQIFRLEGVPYSFSLNEIRVKLGDRVRIEFTSKQGMHDWVLDEFNVKTKQLTGGESDTVEFTADKVGTFEYYCSLGNHRAMGMIGNLIVE